MSVEEVAERLNLHVRTIRAYVRQGRLKAVRIGRQYRIAPEDLEAFTGQPVSVLSPERRNRGRDIEVTSIVQIETIKPDEADRLNEMLVRADELQQANRPGLNRLR